MKRKGVGAGTNYGHPTPFPPLFPKLPHWGTEPTTSTTEAAVYNLAPPFLSSRPFPKWQLFANCSRHGKVGPSILGLVSFILLFKNPRISPLTNFFPAVNTVNSDPFCFRGKGGGRWKGEKRKP